MENPATWGKLEHTIDDALKQAHKGREEGRIGLSNVRQVADAIRKNGLTADEKCLNLHKQIESKIRALPFLSTQVEVEDEILKIVEEEFGKLDHI